MRTEINVEDAVRQLKDIHDIMNLEYDYCYSADDQNPFAYANCFAEDGVLDVGPGFGGRVIGRDIIREFCRIGFPPAMSFSIHTLHNPRIEINGDTATGKWYWQASLTWAATDEAVWQAGIYDDKYVRTAEGWKIKEKVITFLYSTPYDKGWVKEPFIA